MMARSLNQVTLLGNLGADPEIKNTSAGAKVANLSLATSQSWKNAAGEWQEKTQWHRLVVWQNTKGPQLIDNYISKLKKGDKALVQGMIEYRQWEDAQGVKRWSTEIKVDTIVMLTAASGAAAPAAPTALDRAKAASVGATTRDPRMEEFPEALNEEDDLPF
jgi:single-strand DNA-binding protein